LAVLSTVADWAKAMHRRVDVVATAQTGPATHDARFDDAHQRVGRAVDVLETMGVDPTPHVLLGASPSDLLVEFAGATEAALVAVGTHGIGGLSLRALGHVAADVVRRSPCPVLVRRMSS
jgi:nucleotide-binding universal stress UspA family protein